MQAYRITPGGGLKSLERQDLVLPSVLGAHEVRVRIRAVSLNYRDLMVASGNYAMPLPKTLIPTSDASGEVLAVGPAVTRFRAGDRVFGTFFPNWIDGAPTHAKVAEAVGGSIDGLLAETAIVAEGALVKAPAHLSFAEAATLPCAGVTAWNALFVTGGLSPGASVLLLGTGGVSIWGLQLAKAAGLRAFVTSSSDEKLARARELGADGTVNYRQQPQWAPEVLQMTDQRGVDLVLEVGGAGTLSQSTDATAMGGKLVIVGGVSGFGGELEPFKLIGGARSLSGMMVGSRVMAEDLARFVDVNRIRPVIDRTFPFDHAAAAFEHLERGAHFGKVVISVND